MILESSLSLRRPFRERSFGIAGKLLRINWLFMLCICLLAGVGYAALYSAAGGSPQPYAQGQIIRFAGMMVAVLCIAMVDIRIIAKISWPSYVFGILLLLVVMKFGHTGLGAKRWISVGGIELQPSELMKLFLAMALAAYFKRASPEMTGNILFVLPAVLAIMIPFGLILKEPNLGTAVITAAIGGVVMLAAGVRWWWFAIIVAIIAVSAPVLFANASAALSPRAAAQLTALLPRLRGAGVTGVINGFASAPGTAEMNYTLSYERASAVAAFFEARGVPATSLIIVGHGASDPVDSGGSGLNRRVTIVIETS